MDWPEDLVAHLPAPRNDEPGPLRQDIVDELSDHLTCALNRERFRTGDQDEAWRNVLDRFGDPAETARQLWFDAMKERIMSQRISWILMSVMALACIAACGLAWMSVQQGRAVNAAMLARLQKMTQQQAPIKQSKPASLEWNPVKVHLVMDEQAQTPAADYTVELSGYVLDTAKTATFGEVSDADGIADFGLVRPGQHELSVRTPWGEARTLSLIVRPGESHIEPIVCPATPLPKVDVAITVDWPDDLRQAGYWIVCDFQGQGRAVAGKWWAPPSEAATVIVTPASNLFHCSGQFHSRMSSPVSSPFRSLTLVLAETPKEKRPTVQMTLGQHVLRQVFVVTPPSEPDSLAERELITVAPNQTRLMLTKAYGRQVTGYSLGRQGTEVIGVFEAVAGHQNVWTIPLSDEFLFDCRVALAIESLLEETLSHAAQYSTSVYSAVSAFVELDRDHNGEISASEYAPRVDVTSGRGIMLGELPDDVSPPLSCDWVVQRYLSRRSSRSSSRGVSGPRPTSRPPSQSPGQRP